MSEQISFCIMGMKGTGITDLITRYYTASGLNKQNVEYEKSKSNFFIFYKKQTDTFFQNLLTKQI